MSKEQSTPNGASPTLAEHLRWALMAMDLVRNGLMNRRNLVDEDVELSNLRAAKFSIEKALECVPSETARSSPDRLAAIDEIGLAAVEHAESAPSATPCSAPTKAELMECYRFWCHYSSLNEGAQDDENNGRMKWLDKMEEWAL